MTKHIIIDTKTREKHEIAVTKDDIEFTLSDGSNITLPGQDSLDAEATIAETVRQNTRTWYSEILGLSEIELEAKSDRELVFGFSTLTSSAQTRLKTLVSGMPAPEYTQEQQMQDLAIINLQPPGFL